MLNFTELKEKVANAPIGRTKLTDLKKGTYTVAINPDPKVIDGLFLVSEKKVKTPITVNTLAGLRIATSVDGMASIVTTADAREASDKINNLQNLMASEGFSLTESTKFNVIHHLRIKETGSEALVHKNDQYKGYSEYVKKTRKIALDSSETQADRDAKGAKYTEASEELRATGLKNPSAPIEEKNLIMMPVFQVVN